MKFTLVSFYTADWKYPDYANNLASDCKRLGLDYCIEQVPSHNDYVKNCNIKPNFIQTKLQQLKTPILWMDIDGSLLKRPNVLLDSNIQNYDIAGNRPLNNSGRLHVGSIWFNYTSSVMSFLDTWNAYVDRSIDDAAFNSAWTRFKEQLNLLMLPSEYFFIHKKPSLPIPDNTVILHRLSSSDLKMQYKHRVEKK